MSVPIWAYYDLEECPVSISLSPEWAKAGQKFLERALERLGLTDTGAGSSLQELVEAIYDEAGLYVQQGQPREERVKGREEHLQSKAQESLSSLQREAFRLSKVSIRRSRLAK